MLAAGRRRRRRATLSSVNVSSFSSQLSAAWAVGRTRSTFKPHWQRTRYQNCKPTGMGRGGKRRGGCGSGSHSTRRRGSTAAVQTPVEYCSGPWTQDDDDQLAALVATEGVDDWHGKAKALGGRNPNDVWTRWFRFVDPEHRETAEAAERPSKRPKMPDAESNDTNKSTGRFVKKKVALMIGFLGAGYQGFQRNPGAKTLEDAIERALYAAGGIMPSNYGDLKKIAWTRSARTDKGVSAAACCVGMRLVMVRDEVAEMVERINFHMPPDICVHSITPVTGGFDAKLHCSKRRYEYLLPTYALRRRDEPASADTAADAAHLSKQLQSLRRVLAKFEGTHNFHNYTTNQVKATDAQAKRFIISFQASDPFVLGGLQLVRCTVLGQSFMMHQVRDGVGQYTIE